jgi:hypothetical protein
MWFDLSTGTLLASVAIALAVLLLVLAVGWAVVWLLSLRD